MTYEHHLTQLRNTDPVTANLLGPLSNLKDILRWVPSAGLSLMHFDSIQQDEYNYDVIFPWYDHRWIAFGVT
ncbi:MAG TPA: hypothetical protein VGJ05_18850 [Fimbriiglobus sp.]|jgi:hypothetical protein